MAMSRIPSVIIRQYGHGLTILLSPEWTVLCLLPQYSYVRYPDEEEFVYNHGFSDTPLHQLSGSDAPVPSGLSAQSPAARHMTLPVDPTGTGSLKIPKEFLRQVQSCILPVIRP